MINGATNATSTVAVGTSPETWRTRSPTSYVANTGSNNVTVIDGATNSTSTGWGNTPTGIAVNSVTNKIYVTNNGSSNVATVIDAANEPTSTVSHSNQSLRSRGEPW